MSGPQMIDCHRLDEHEWTGYFPEHLASRLNYLRGLAIALGCTVVVGTYADPAVSRYGDYWAPGHRIRINSKNHGYQAVDAMAHEIGHAMFRHGEFGNLGFEAAANRVALALLLDEGTFREKFDPDRHLYTSPDRDIRDVVDLFGCGWKAMRWAVDAWPASTRVEAQTYTTHQLGDGYAELAIGGAL